MEKEKNIPQEAEEVSGDALESVSGGRNHVPIGRIFAVPEGADSPVDGPVNKGIDAYW